MQIRQLEYVAAIVQYKTMRKAAQELYISEAAMSQQLRSLEAELGFPLFERNGRLLHLSTRGEELLPDLHTLLQAKQKLEQSVTRIKNPLAGPLRLGMTPGLASLFFALLFDKFKHAHPGVALDLHEGGTATVVELVKNQAIDLALFGAPDLAYPHLYEIKTEYLFSSELVAIASQHHRLAHKERISRIQLKNEAIISLTKEFEVDDLFYKVIGADFEENVICSINNPLTALPLVQAGTGIVFLPRFLVEAPQMEERLRGLCVLDLAPELSFPIHYAYACLRHQFISEPLRTLIEVINGMVSGLAA